MSDFLIVVLAALKKINQDIIIRTLKKKSILQILLRNIRIKETYIVKTKTYISRIFTLYQT